MLLKYQLISPKESKKVFPKSWLIYFWSFQIGLWHRFVCRQGILVQDGHLKIPNFKLVPVFHISYHPDQISTASPSYDRVLFH